MANNVPGFTLPYTADADIDVNLICKFGAGDNGSATAAVADSSTAKLLGVSKGVQTAAGQIVDIVHSGSANVRYGATVTAGDWLTSDSTGRAVTANPSTGVTATVIGRALESGVVGDIRPALINVGQIKG